MAKTNAFGRGRSVVGLLALAGACLVHAESAEEAYAAIRDQADRRIAEIRAAPNGAVPEGAPVRYLSERAGSDGAMPEKFGRMEVAPRKDYSADTVALAR